MLNPSNHHRDERPTLTKENKPAISFKSVNWSRLFGYLKPYKGKMTLAILALLVSRRFGLAFSLVLVRLLSSVTISAPGGLLLCSIVPAGLHRRAYRLRPAHVFIRPSATTITRFLCKSARRRYYL